MIGHYTKLICVFSFLQLSAMTPLDRQSSHRRHWSMARWLEVGLGGQLFHCEWPHNPTTRIRSATTILAKNNYFRTNKGNCASCHKSVALQLVTSVNVANVQQCFISSTAVHRPSWRVAYHSFTWLKTPLFKGLCHMAH